ncbi:MAG: pyridoxal-phosphate dependent enzyme [Acidimicrobiia bacterium]|nr:pyridoxal-phosphate dependent enzyme [Acidimicrobiia bacterium]
MTSSSEHPFLRYRERLDSYRAAIDLGWNDQRFVDLVSELDDAVASVAGHGFVRTPFGRASELADAARLGGDLWVKDETDNVGHSHKARHLFGIALSHAVRGDDTGAPYAISSCGNAAIAAATIAKGIGRELHVFVPTWADAAVIDELTALGAVLKVSPRRDGEQGDPCFLRYRESVAEGAVPFTVQGTEVPAALDGGRTLGWELAEQLAAAVGAPASLDVIYVQVGGGALAASTSMALFDAVEAGWLSSVPRIRAVQPEQAHPLVRAWQRLVGDAGGADPVAVMTAARADPDAYMTPWETEPKSFATGILDDVTYDWLPVVEAMARSGGTPVLASEETLHRSYELAHAHTDIPVCPTGAAGLAGLLTDPPGPTERAVVLFTGFDR